MNASRVRFHEAMYYQGRKVPELRAFYNYFISGGKALAKKKPKKPKKPKKRKIDMPKDEEAPKTKSAFLPSLDPDMLTPLSSASPSPQLSQEEDQENESLHVSPKEEEEEDTSSSSNTSNTSQEEDQEEEKEDMSNPSPKESSPSSSSSSSSSPKDSPSPEKELCKDDNISDQSLNAFQQKINACLEEKAQPPKAEPLKEEEEDQSNESDDMTRIQHKIQVLEEKLGKK